MLAISLDGRLAFPAGGPSHLGGPGDRGVLEQSLAWADACLIGAGTLRAHHCTCLIRDPELLARRAEAGRPPQPTAIVVTSGLTPQFPSSWGFFRQPLTRWLLCAATPPPGSACAGGFERVLAPAASWELTLQSLAAQGLSRIVLLGGAQLAASCLNEDAVDALQLTLTPRVLGGVHGWIPFAEEGLAAAVSAPDAWVLQGADVLQGDELVVRYRRRGRPIDASRTDRAG